MNEGGGGGGGKVAEQLKLHSRKKNTSSYFSGTFN